MLVNVPKCWNGAAYMKSKSTCIFALIVQPSAVLKVLEQYGSPFSLD